MRLQADVYIARPAEEVWAYLGDVSNVAKWDRGVAATQVTSTAPPGVGFQFDTLALRNGGLAAGDWGKMSYRIASVDPVNGCTIELTSRTGNARYFRSAWWNFRVETERDGARVYCTAEFRLKLRYCFFGPVFLGMKSAIRRDLESLKLRIEEHHMTPNFRPRSQ